MPATPKADGWRFDLALEAVGRTAAAEAGDRAAAAYRGRIVLECLLEQAGQAARPSHEALTELYVENPQQAQLTEPAYGEAIAEELGLRPGLSPRELNASRRAFALANHPDRVPTASRDEANRRMTIANILIDRALRESHGPS
jgi:hypothetical protein